MKKLFLLLIVLLLSSCSFDMIKEDTNVDEVPKYQITIADSIKNGMVSSDKFEATKGEIITLTITPDTGYSLDYYLVQGVVQKENTFTMPASDITIYAYFTINSYNITINENILNGSISISKSKAHYNDEITVEVTPSEGYELDLLYINDLVIEGTTFKMLATDVLVTATFKRIVVDNECDHNYLVSVLKQPLCEERGLDSYTCSKCGDSYTDETEKLGHNYIDDECSICGELLEKSYLNELFGNDIDIYTNNEENPYNINLNQYGSDVKVYFYEPNLSIMTDPYVNIDKESFYSDYERSTSYEDAYYRTQHKLMSGDITDQYYLPEDGKVVLDNKAVRISTATYVLDTKGNYLAYIPNVLDGENYVIFYGAAYTSLNDVAAYLLAFGEAPINQIKNKNNKGISEALSSWGKYGRVNNNSFSGDISKYPYEPELPNILGTNKVYYNEIDFGTTGNYTLSNRNKTYNQVAYNNGYSITRGAVRIVYVSDKTVKSIDKRYVFYTYNHYNDFQEYLNYDNGWGYRFGNESAGNEYCYNTNDYNNFGCSAPSKYPTTLLKKYSELI